MFEPCLLCGSPETRLHHQNKRRIFLRCEICDAITVPTHYHLTTSQESEEYAMHQNDPADAGYRRFLGKLIPHVQAQVEPGAEGLDFGCGPGPTLHLMLQDLGYAMAIYDPIFASDPAALARQYDFITCTEVVEHFNQPMQSWQQLASLLKSGAILAVMTWLHDEIDNFKTWRYKDDPTHVIFYSTHTLNWIAEQLGFALELIKNQRVAVMRRT